jgi:hypothetical protein
MQNFDQFSHQLRLAARKVFASLPLGVRLAHAFRVLRVAGAFEKGLDRHMKMEFGKRGFQFPPREDLYKRLSAAIRRGIRGSRLAEPEMKTIVDDIITTLITGVGVSGVQGKSIFDSVEEKVPAGDWEGALKAMQAFAKRKGPDFYKRLVGLGAGMAGKTVPLQPGTSEDYEDTMGVIEDRLDLDDRDFMRAFRRLNEGGRHPALRKLVEKINKYMEAQANRSRGSHHLIWQAILNGATTKREIAEEVGISAAAVGQTMKKMESMITDLLENELKRDADTVRFLAEYLEVAA